MVTTFQTLAAEGWFGDSLKVTAIGLIVVFTVLAILIVLIEALHLALKDRKGEVPKQAVQVNKEPEKRISAGVMAEAPEASDAENDGDFIAAVSAAITCVTGNSNFKIKSIKKG
jgi:Na+-transporting methylmalonyl-CoA/oxaloacetate decarboxylase gamma subunit